MWVIDIFTLISDFRFTFDLRKRSCINVRELIVNNILIVLLVLIVLVSTRQPVSPWRLFNSSLAITAIALSPVLTIVGVVIAIRHVIVTMVFTMIIIIIIRTLRWILFQLENVVVLIIEDYFSFLVGSDRMRLLLVVVVVLFDWWQVLASSSRFFGLKEMIIRYFSQFKKCGLRLIDWGSTDLLAYAVLDVLEFLATGGNIVESVLQLMWHVNCFAIHLI